MSPLVVLFAIVGAVCGSLVPAQPIHLPALVLDPHGRPLETAEVINARALHLQAKALDHLDGHVAPLHAEIVPAVHAPLIHAPLIPSAAVSHQSRVDIRTSQPIISHEVHAAPLVAAHSISAWPALGHGISHGLGHLLKKRSLALGHLAYAAPIVAHHAPAAVSHQSRVDIHSSPAVVAHTVHAPIIEHAPIIAHEVAAPIVAHAIPAAVSHQSRVDVRASHPIISHALHAPLVDTHSISAWPSYGHELSHGLGLGHLLKKRSLAIAHVLPSAVSHQSRVDVITSHAAPQVIAHAVAPIAAAHAAPVEIVSSHITPLVHSAVWSAPAAHWAHSPLALASHW